MRFHRTTGISIAAYDARLLIVNKTERITHVIGDISSHARDGRNWRMQQAHHRLGPVAAPLRVRKALGAVQIGSVLWTVDEREDSCGRS
jgi:hypothetical protein